MHRLLPDLYLGRGLTVDQAAAAEGAGPVLHLAALYAVLFASVRPITHVKYNRFDWLSLIDCHGRLSADFLAKIFKKLNITD